MQIRKANGTIEEFDEKKLINAIVKTGTKIDVAMEICEYVKHKCSENYKDQQPIKTEYIYHIAFKHLKNISKASALKVVRCLIENKFLLSIITEIII
jgi:transcriptional regulator NrdR family protein